MNSFVVEPVKNKSQYCKFEIRGFQTRENQNGILSNFLLV